MTMEYYELDFFGLKRRLPMVAIGPKMRIASFNLLGDVEITDVAAEKLVEKIIELEFEYLVGPEVKVVPLIHKMSELLFKKSYVICRKSIMGYMVRPVSSEREPRLVVDGIDAAKLKGSRVILVDDVVSTGRTLKILENLMDKIGAKVVSEMAIFKQGEDQAPGDLVFLEKLPLFRN